MQEVELWKYLRKELELKKRAMLMVVSENKGSSPGRVGFKMIISLDGLTQGTIGGGNVEHSLVIESLKMLKNGAKEPVVCRQVHSLEDSEYSSGMICSGEQTVILYPLFEHHLSVISDCLMAQEKLEKTHFVLSPESFSYVSSTLPHSDFEYQYNSTSDWFYKENLYRMTDVYIFGAGHVCLALSEVLSKLGFYITIVDDRKDLPIMVNNNFANKKMILDYKEVSEKIVIDPNAFYIIMTHSHNADGLVLSQLIDKECKYLGMLGSPRKVKEIYGKLEEQGIPAHLFKKVYSPIGLRINSQTVSEIAISIAAELISIRNMDY